MLSHINSIREYIDSMCNRQNIIVQWNDTLHYNNGEKMTFVIRKVLYISWIIVFIYCTLWMYMLLNYPYAFSLTNDFFVKHTLSTLLLLFVSRMDCSTFKSWFTFLSLLTATSFVVMTMVMYSKYIRDIYSTVVIIVSFLLGASPYFLPYTKRTLWIVSSTMTLQTATILRIYDMTMIAHTLLPKYRNVVYSSVS